MVTLTTVASTLLERVAGPASELGHGRFPTFGPPPGACHCWHVEDVHDHACVEAGCACGAKFTRPAFGWLHLILAVVRGGR